jgi:hypothetical protein
MWATLASFFFWLSPLQSLGFNHTLKLRKIKKKSDAPPKEALEANWFFFFFVIRLQQNKIKYKGKRSTVAKRSPPPEKLDRKMY